MAKQPTLTMQRSSMLNGINGVGRFLRATGLDPFKIDADSIIKKAKRKAQYDLPIPARAEEGLRKLIHSINTESFIDPFGALAVKGLVERTLYGRFKVEQHLKTFPEIEHEAIKQPVFIIGMPRTGTSILHAILNEDQAHRSPLAWECLLPHPVPKPDSFNDNEQLKTISKEFEQLFKLVPDFKRKHYMEADSPQECLGITALDFNSFQFSAQLYLPSYMEWFAAQSDQLETLRFHKRFLQYLQSGGVKADRWLLKSPVHLMRLEEIFEVYPDAKIIMTHREASKVVSSASSLITSVRSLYSNGEDPVRTGQEQLETWSTYFTRFLNSRNKINKEDQIIDVRFEDFANDQLAVIKRIYTHFEWDLTEDALERFQYFLDQNPRDKHGIHNYKIEDFGLTEKLINENFTAYNKFLDGLN